jgi:hypothetical protein
MDAVFWADNLTGSAVKAEARVRYFNNIFDVFVGFGGFVWVFLTNKNICGTTPDTFDAAGAQVMVNYDSWGRF